MRDYYRKNREKFLHYNNYEKRKKYLAYQKNYYFKKIKVGHFKIEEKKKFTLKIEYKTITIYFD